MGWGWLCLFLTLIGLAHTQPEYRIGWQAGNGTQAVLDQFSPTFAEVSSKLNATFTIVPFVHDPDLQQAANNGSLQFVFGGPTVVYCIILSANIQPLATVITLQGGGVSSVLSGSIIVPDNSSVHRVNQLRNKVIAVGQWTGLTTFQSESQLLLTYNMNVFVSTKALVEYTAPSSITAAVAAGVVDAGFVPTKVQPPGIRVLNATAHQDQPLPSTTPTYSNQVFAATANISEEFRTAIVEALINVDPDILNSSGYGGWNVPRSFVDIRRLAQATGLLKASGDGCNDLSQSFAFVNCPAGFQLIPQASLATSCQDSDFSCPPDAMSCICSPCEAIHYPKKYGTLTLPPLLGLVLGISAATLLFTLAVYRWSTLRPRMIPWTKLHVDASMVLGQAKQGVVLQAEYGSRQVVLKRAFVRHSHEKRPFFDGGPSNTTSSLACFCATNPSNVLLNLVGIKGAFDKKCRIVAAQRALDHPNVLKVYGVTAGDDGCEVVAVTELASKGTLAELVSNPSVDINIPAKLRLGLDVASGLNYLHTLHPSEVGRKLRLHHLLLNDSYVCMLNCCFAPPTGSGRSRLYMAPELLRGGKMTQQSDMYAFGMLLWEILHRKQIYDTEDVDEIVFTVQSQTGPDLMRPLLTEADVPASVETLLTSCWAEDPTARPSASTAMQVLHECASQSFTGDLMLETRQQDALLRQMLPEHVVKALKEGRTPSFRKFEMVTIYFSDIQGFTSISSSQEPEQIITMLDDLFGKFDALCIKLELMKVETIGDACEILTPLCLLCPCICL